MTIASSLLIVSAVQAASPVATDLPMLPPSSRDYKIGPDDIVQVSVLGHEDLLQTLLVQADGTFNFPLIGVVEANDLTPLELEDVIAERLAKGYIRDPQVSVAITEFRSKTVLVMGEVSRPGPYPLSGSMRIVEILARAGISSSASTEVLVVRPRKSDDPGAGPAVPLADLDGTNAEILRVDIDAIRSGDLSENIRLLPGDTIFVPQPPKFFILGEVRNPGQFSLAPGTTVREAITIAGGFSDFGSSGRVQIIRTVDGEKQEIKASLDEQVLGNDTIVVKGRLF